MLESVNSSFNNGSFFFLSSDDTEHDDSDEIKTLFIHLSHHIQCHQEAKKRMNGWLRICLMFIFAHSSMLNGYLFLELSLIKIIHIFQYHHV